MKIFYTIVVIAVIALISGLIGYNLVSVPDQPVGSVQSGSEYKSTTFMASTLNNSLIKAESGTLGSIVINNLGAGNVVFYDASSSIYWQRTTQATSSLRVVGVIDASQAAGTYTYDASFYDGLLAVFSGTQGTSTLTWR